MARLHEFIKLSESELEKLTTILNQGIHPAREMKRAHMLLLNHQGYSAQQIVEVIGCSLLTFYNIRNKYKEGGLEAALREKPRTGRPVVYSGADRAKITGLACTDAPDGYSQWSLRLLADKAVELRCVNTKSIGHTTIHRILKKTI